MTATQWISELRAARRFLAGLRPFLRQPLDSATARRQLETQLRTREESFRRVLRHAVFEHRPSPYRRLFEWARITFDDVSGMLAREGLERTLDRLCDAGVSLTLEEFKGWHPVRRPGLELEVHAEDFDNPLTLGQYEARTGGSTSAPRRIVVDLDLLAHESACHFIAVRAVR